MHAAAAAAKLLSHVRLCAIPETAAHQAPPSLGFSRQEHWSGLPFPSPCFCSWLFRSDSWVCLFFFCLFDLWSRICPNCTWVKLFLVPYSLFVFCCSRRGVSRRKHCGTAAEDPKSQLVSDIPRVTETYQQRFGLVAPYQPIRSL